MDNHSEFSGENVGKKIYREVAGLKTAGSVPSNATLHSQKLHFLRVFKTRPPDVTLYLI